MIFLPQIRQPTGTKPDIQSDIIPVVLPQLHRPVSYTAVRVMERIMIGTRSMDFSTSCFCFLFSGKVIINHRLSAGCPEAEGNMVVL